MNEQLDYSEGIITLENYEEQVSDFTNKYPSFAPFIANCSVEEILDQVDFYSSKVLPKQLKYRTFI